MGIFNVLPTGLGERGRMAELNRNLLRKAEACGCMKEGGSDPCGDTVSAIWKTLSSE